MDVTMPDGTVIQGVPDGVTKDQLMAKYAAHTAQPTDLQTAIASPAGRFLHDAVLKPVQGALSMVPSFGGEGAAQALGLLDKPYNDALAAQRNRPGYADARAQADAVLAKHPSGLSDQLISGLTPAMAGTAGLFGGGLNASNAQADAQAASQAAYQKANPIRSFGANLVGGFLAGPEAPKLPAGIGQTAPTVADLKKAASAAYKQVDNSGIVIAGPSYDRMVTDLQTKLNKLGIDPALHPDATAAFNRLNDIKSKGDVSFQNLNTLREIAGDAAGATLPRDAMRGNVIQDHIDDYVDSLTPADLSGTGTTTDPTATVASLNNARDLYSRAKQAETIQKVIDKADIRAAANYSQSGQENSLRQGFKSLALNDRAMTRLAPDVQTAVKAVAKGSPVSNVMRAVGKYAPHGPVATAAGMGLGAMTGGVAGAAEGGMASLAVPMIGEAARAAATRMTTAAAQRALNTAALGRSAAKPLPVPPLQLPQLTPRSVFPYGLFGSSFGQLQPQYQ